MAYINLGQVMWPVGSVYSSFSATSPASLLGGTWTAITGRFLYGNSSTATGGSNSQTYDFNHNHLQTLGFTSSYGSANGCAYTTGGTVASLAVLTSTSSFSGVLPDLTGPAAQYGGTKFKSLSTKTIDNMPAYQSVYMWRRTA